MAATARDTSYSFETVACLCAAIIQVNGSLSTKYYDLMSAIDGKRTANSFQHQFRAVLKRARELNDALKAGIEPAPVEPTARKAVKDTSKANGNGTKKRGRGTKTKSESPDGVHEEDGDAAGGDEPPAKKVKTQIKYELQ